MRHSKINQKLTNWRNSRLKHIINSAAPDYRPEVPFYRGEFIYKSFDFGEKITTVDLFKTNHIACYIVVIDGKLWSYKAGRNKIDAEIRRRNPPVAGV